MRVEDARERAYSYCVISAFGILRRAPQHGQRGKVLASASVNRLRMVVIEFGM